jgi:nucleoside 2-deoxyribosyltransferase
MMVGDFAVYVAGPWGFTTAGQQYYKASVLPALRQAGFRVLDPWRVGNRILGPVIRNGQSTKLDILTACSQVGAANEEMIRRADSLFALVDGCDLDSGTCTEIGFAAGLGLPIVGMRTDLRSAGDVPEIPINLQVLHFIEKSGGPLVGALPQAIRALRQIRREASKTIRAARR